MTGASLCVIPTAAYGAWQAPTSSPSNTWLIAVSSSSVAATVRFYYAYAPTVSSAMTFSFSGSSNYETLSPICVKGTTGSTVDQTNQSAFTSAATSTQPGSITPSVNGEFIVAGGAVTNGPTGASFAIGTPTFNLFTNLGYNGSSNEGAVAGYIIQATAAPLNPVISWSGSQVSGGSAIASFK